MLKLIIKILKRINIAFLVLYGLNMILTNVSFYIPINFITLGSITLLGTPGLIGLIVMVFII